jgi:imidazolonepropionase-like amidohydrolase
MKMRRPLLLITAAMAGLAAGDSPGQTADSNPGFVDVTKSSGAGDAIDRHYERHPKWWLSGLNLVDLDGDGHLDLFLAAHGAGRSLALLNDGRGHFKEADGSYPATEIHVAADINGDGRLDLQMTWQDGGGKWWLNESKPGRLSFRESSVTAGQARANAMIDLNRDGNIDWLHERPGVVFEFGDGAGNFKPGGHVEVAPTRNEINIHPADFNGDGFIDLALHWGRYDYERGRSRVYLNDGKMNFTDATEKAGLREDGLAIKGVGDVNQDGRLDLIVLDGGRPELYVNDGKGSFGRRASTLQGMEWAGKPRYVSWGLAVVTDFDNDGVADILWNGRHFLWLMRGIGNSGFTYMNKAWGVEDKAAASVDDGLCFGDIDSDGDLDIIGYTGSLDAHRLAKVYRNDLPARNWLRVRLVGAGGNVSAAGTKIRVTERGQPEKLLWFEQVSLLDSQSAHSYYSIAPTERHFGLGSRSEVDLRVEFYPSGKRVERAAQANSTVLIAETERTKDVTTPTNSLHEINPPVSGTNLLVAIVGATLIDGRGGSPVSNAVVIVRGDRIVASGDRKSTTIPPEAEVFDAKGRTLLPGFIDSHFHIERDYELPRLFLSHGITSVRDPGQWIEIYEPIRESALPQPRCFVAGPHLDCPPHAHPQDAFAVMNAGETRRAVDRFVDEGASVIKVYYRLPLDLIGVACEAAHRRGVPVTAHLELVDADDAIRAGLDGVEHVTSFGTALAEPDEAERFRKAVTADNEARRKARYELWSRLDLRTSLRVRPLIDLIVSRQIFLSPTLAVFERRRGDRGVTEVEAGGYENMLEFVRLCHRAGVRIVVGSHSSVPKAGRGWAYQRELELLRECGLSPMETIVAATRNNAEFFRASARLGTIEVGKLADLVLLDGDPMRDTQATRRVARVMLNGRWLNPGQP